ncbi:unnamed protein product [Pieris brassicae]|uniref:Uncharacterized protein n=1 Tax=Pieris brassicae TaxID=7116 RepID=A0A9P0T4C5_PIEBR|nr:unnamed protein product [Pieris brassicae]
MGQSDMWYSVVRVCFCVFVLAAFGYSIVRQQILEQRLQVLEEQQLLLELRLRPSGLNVQVSRSRRDATDCICPADLPQSYRYPDTLCNGDHFTISGDKPSPPIDT